MKHTKTEASSKKETQAENEFLTDNDVKEIEIPEDKTDLETSKKEVMSKSEKKAQKEEETKEEEKLSETELEVTKKALVDLKSQYDHLNDTYLRSLAEFDNFRKRSLREKSELIKTGGESVLVNLLTIVDDIERGLTAAKDAKDVEALKKGMELINSKLQGFLKQNGVSAIETEGKDFDTDIHEAITTIPAPNEDLKGKVIDCVQKGYYLHDKVIRFAKVVVGK
jgi:molecular chaperone GrpE